jgi:DNA gyrase subunit B
LFGVFTGGGRATKSKKTKAKRKGSQVTPGAHWAYSDEELDALIEKRKLKSPRIVRYKGLGEMNPDTLWETTLDPETRTILRISVDDEEMVSEALQALMGSDPSTRYRLISENAEKIELDI